MVDKKYKGMSRTDLIAVICEREKNISDLKFEIEILKIKLSENVSTEPGTIASEVLKINNIFENAQKSADMYVERVKKLTETQKKDLKTERLEAEEEIKQMLEKSRVETEVSISKAKEEAERIIEEAEEQANEKWIAVRKQLQEFLSVHQNLRELLKNTDVDTNKLI